MLSSALELVVFDECLSQMWPDLHSTMLCYLHKVANERYLIYAETARVCTSLQRTCYFLSKSKMVSKPQKNFYGLTTLFFLFFKFALVFLYCFCKLSNSYHGRQCLVQLIRPTQEWHTFLQVGQLKGFWMITEDGFCSRHF